MRLVQKSIRDYLAASGARNRFLSDSATVFHLEDLDGRSTLDRSIESFRGRSVLIATEHQLPAVLALLQLDGVARRIILAPPDLSQSAISHAIAMAAVDIVVTDNPLRLQLGDDLVVARCGAEITRAEKTPTSAAESEWILFTSGTSGQPKMVAHNLRGLSGAFASEKSPAAIWSTFYDVRRYGGLQMLLRALLCDGAIVLSDPREAVDEFLTRISAMGVTHLSGTPSHWRCALMSGLVHQITPQHVRLSGEIADQAILDYLRKIFPVANITHAFASTEAGVGFDVTDGLAGFPASLVGDGNAEVAICVEEGSLRIRSSRTASCYIGLTDKVIADGAGFVDTGDLVELRNGRYHFIGRRGGVINVGGLKVHPEEVEAIINLNAAVQMSRVRGRPSPITGAIVVADVVMNQSHNAGSTFDDVCGEIWRMCRQALPAHKVPARIRAVASLDVAASGKLIREIA